MPESRGSVGARIRELRGRAGLKSQDLAEAVGLDASAMSNIENGKRSVKTDELLRIAAALHVSPVALLDEGSLLARLAVAPRVGLGDRLDATVVHRLTELAELHELLQTEGIPAPVALDDVPQIDESQWRASATRLASWAAERLSVTAEGDERFAALVDAIEERLRVDVIIEHIDSGTFAGAALTDREFPLLLVSADQRRPRALFTLAHELGHVLSGKGVVAVDVDLVGKNESERFANAFAAALLMPEDVIRNQIADTGRGAETLARLVDRLGVSFESLTYRLHNLGLLNARGRDQLRAEGLRGVLSRIEDDDLVRRLLGRLRTRPERRPPTWLAVRAFEGFRRGAISVRPLARLLEADSEDLLDYLARLDQAGEIVEDTDFGQSDENLSDDDLFSGSPV